MSDNLNKTPKITWGASFANTLNIGYPLDNPKAYSLPRQGSEVVIAPSGVRDSWSVGDDEFLEGDIRWIPGENTTDPVATGWDGATGFKALLEWARDMNKFRWYPDKDGGTYYTCYLVEPIEAAPGRESDGTAVVHIKILDDGTQGAFLGYTRDPE